MPLVYRVELPDANDPTLLGEGPYSSPFTGLKQQLLNGMASNHRGWTHPSPEAEGQPYSLYPDAYDPGCFFGFVSMDQLVEWFYVRDRVMLQGLGFVISVYEVEAEDWYPGTRQVCFRHQGQAPVRREGLLDGVSERALMEARARLAVDVESHTDDSEDEGKLTWGETGIEPKSESEPEATCCPMCGEEGQSLAKLGNSSAYHCRGCGMVYSVFDKR